MSELTWLEKANAAGVDGFMHPNELQVLVDLATGRDVLEVGSFKGLSAWCMAHTAKSVFSVDTHRANTAGQTQMEELTTFEDFKRAVSGFDNVRWFVGTSQAAAEHVDWTFDMVFLDAMHDYVSIRDDIARWWPKLRVGGILAGHDYGHAHFPGVKQAFDERFGPAPEGTHIVTLRWIVKHDGS
jgi:predicted O-methyltransferase YrrM